MISAFAEICCFRISRWARSGGRAPAAAALSVFSVKWCLFLFVSVPALLSAPPAAQSEERITSFISLVDVQRDGELVVEETISVISEGKRIRRGIYRDFPTSYKDTAGHRYRVGFSVAAVERDGRPEPFHTAKMANGIRVYMGDSNTRIAAGPHTYTLRYVTNRQLGFFADHDELYWNVTGNGWSFSIDTARVTITIPQSGEIQNYQWYTGAAGGRSADAVLVDRGRNFITMQTTVPLPPGSGFTVVAGWQKGVIKEAGRMQRLFWFIRDYPLFIAGTLSLLALIIYYCLSWRQVGRDPESGPIIPMFTPPDNISPAAGRYIMNMGFDQKAFAAMLVNMAVKGVLKIEQQDDDYTLHLLTHDVERLTPGELAVRKKLFKRSETVELKQKNNSTVRAAISALQASLRRDLLNIYFKNNRAKLAGGVALSLLVLLFVALSGKDFKTTSFITVWLLGWSAGTMLLFLQMVRGWQLVKVSGRASGSIKKALSSTAFFLPFAGGFVFGVAILCTQLSRFALILLLLTLCLNFLFAWLLKAPTLPGRMIMDELEGLRMYMAVAEKDRLNILNPPEKTPELFERLLPWALALDVEQQWGEQFADILAQAGSDQQQYQPTWYSSSHGFSGNTFSTSLSGGLASSISSSSVAPGSSSGFSSGGGGGFSGGGGGGGGGGGW